MSFNILTREGLKIFDNKKKKLNEKKLNLKDLKEKNEEEKIIKKVEEEVKNDESYLFFLGMTYLLADEQFEILVSTFYEDGDNSNKTGISKNLINWLGEHDNLENEINKFYEKRRESNFMSNEFWEKEEIKKLLEYVDKDAVIHYKNLIGEDEIIRFADFIENGGSETLQQYLEKQECKKARKIKEVDEQFEFTEFDRIRKKIWGMDGRKKSVQRRLFDIGLDIEKYDWEQQLLLFTYIEYISYNFNKKLTKNIIPVKEVKEFKDSNRQFLNSVTKWNTDAIDLMIKFFEFGDTFDKDKYFDNLSKVNKHISNSAYATRGELTNINKDDVYSRAFSYTYGELAERANKKYKKVVDEFIGKGDRWHLAKTLFNEENFFMLYQSSKENVATIIKDSLEESYEDIAYETYEMSLMWILILSTIIFHIEDLVHLHDIYSISNMNNKVKKLCEMYDYNDEIQSIKNKVFKSKKFNVFFDFAYIVGAVTVKHRLEVYLKIMESVNNDFKGIEKDEIYYENIDSKSKIRIEDLMKIFVPKKYHNKNVKKHIKSRMEIVFFLTDSVCNSFVKRNPSVDDLRVMYYALYIRKNSNIKDLKIVMKTIKEKAAPKGTNKSKEQNLNYFEVYWLKEIYISTYLFINNFEISEQYYDDMCKSRKEIVENLIKSLDMDS